LGLILETVFIIVDYIINMAIAIFLTGYSGSGKTTLARLLRAKYGFVSFKVGDYIKAAAKKAGVDHKIFTEELMQRGGDAAVMDAIAPFLKGVMKGKNGIIIEGVNNVASYDRLRSVLERTKSLLFVLKAPTRTRVTRVMGRKDIGKEAAKQYVSTREADRRDMGMEALEKVATRVFVNNYPNIREFLRAFEAEVATRTRYLNQLRSRPRSKKSNRPTQKRK
jgi:cytidylate kinase